MAVEANADSPPRRGWNPPRRAIPTKAGIFALVAPLILGIAAVNSSNNLLFLLFGGSLGIIVLSGILSERNLKRIRVDLLPLSEVYVDEPAQLQVFLRRDGDPRRLPQAFGVVFREKPKTMWAMWKGIIPTTALNVQVPVLDGASSTRIGRRTFSKRGMQRLTDCELVTSYPFGLLNKARDADPDAEVLVRPRRVAVPPELASPRGSHDEGEAASNRGVGVDLYGLREATERDSVLRLHGLRSLTLGRDVVIETEALERPTAWIGIANGKSADPIALERAIEIVSSVLNQWDRDGYRVGLATLGRRYPPGHDALPQLLDTLAVLGSEPLVHEPGDEPALWFVPAGAEAPARATTQIHVDDKGSIRVDRSRTAGWAAR